MGHARLWSRSPTFLIERIGRPQACRRRPLGTLPAVRLWPASSPPAFPSKCSPGGWSDDSDGGDVSAAWWLIAIARVSTVLPSTPGLNQP